MNTRSAHLPTPSPSPNLYPVATSPVRRRSTCSQYGKSNHNLPPPSPPTLCLSNPSSHPSVQSSDHPVPSVRQTSASSKKSTRTQRKINHSIIEKRRRVRINDCLEALRSLVPGWDELKSFGAGAGAKEGEDENGWVGEGKGAGKEFKLEVLMRTVTYVKHLQESITRLETKRLSSQSIDPDETEEELDGENEKDEDEDEDEEYEDDNTVDTEKEKPVVSTHSSTNTDPIPTSSSFLPSISSLTSVPSINRSALSYNSPEQLPSQSQFFFPLPPISSSLSPPYLPRPRTVSLSPRSQTHWNSIHLSSVTRIEDPASSLSAMPHHQPAHTNPCSSPNLSTAYGLASSPGLGLYTSLVKIEDYESRGMKRKRIQVVEEVEAASALLSFSNVRGA